jgi:hypothetical protein
VIIPKKFTIGHIRSESHKNKCFEQQGNNNIVYQINQKNQALGSKLVTYAIKNTMEELLDVRSFFNTVDNIVNSLLISALDELNLIKFNFEIFSTYYRQIEDDEYSVETKSFMTASEHSTKEDNINEKIKRLYEIIRAKVEDFQEQGSGWCLLKILRLEINVAKWCPLGGGCRVKIPKFISNKKQL